MLGVFFPTVIATYGGVDGVPRSLIRMAQSFIVLLFLIGRGVSVLIGRAERHLPRWR